MVDAEESNRNAVVRALRAAGFVTRAVARGSGVEKAAESFRPDLVLLEAVLPDVDGFEVARRLADGQRRMPLIFVTMRSAPQDRVTGLAFADDYVTKPVTPAEVVARVRAVLRRTRPDLDGVLRFADVVLDERRREVRRSGQPVELTRTEFDLLRFFMLNSRRVLTKQQILQAVWNDAASDDVGIVETYVSYLRKKLDRLGPPLIQTVRFVGYALREAG